LGFQETAPQAPCRVTTSVVIKQYQASGELNSDDDKTNAANLSVDGGSDDGKEDKDSPRQELFQGVLSILIREPGLIDGRNKKWSRSQASNKRKREWQQHEPGSEKLSERQAPPDP
jgi:hypothetical protein